jgi:hypothetical protein
LEWSPDEQNFTVFVINQIKFCLTASAVPALPDLSIFAGLNTINEISNPELEIDHPS